MGHGDRACQGRSRRSFGYSVHYMERKQHVIICRFRDFRDGSVPLAQVAGWAGRRKWEGEGEGWMPR